MDNDNSNNGHDRQSRRRVFYKAMQDAAIAHSTIANVFAEASKHSGTDVSDAIRALVRSARIISETIEVLRETFEP